MKNREVQVATDAELLSRFSDADDEDAFRELVRRHSSLVRGVCKRQLSQKEDIEDSVQMTFLTLLQQGKQIRSDAFGSWLYQVAFRISVRVRRCRIVAETTSWSATDGGNGLDGLHELEQREAAAALDEELSCLPARLRETLILFHFRQMSRAEIADVLNITVAEVKQRLERGRKRLRSQLLRRGISFGLIAAFLSAPEVHAEAFDNRFADELMESFQADDNLVDESLLPTESNQGRLVSIVSSGHVRVAMAVIGVLVIAHLALSSIGRAGEDEPVVVALANTPSVEREGEVVVQSYDSTVPAASTLQARSGP